MKTILNYSIVILLITNVVMYFTLRKLPEQIEKSITKALNNDTTKNKIEDDTVKIYIKEQVSLKSRSSFFHGEGKTKNSFKISDKFTYDPMYPEKIWDGYLTIYETNNNLYYYIWSNNKIDNQHINGWFLTDNMIRFQLLSDTIYVNVIYPIVRDNINNENITIN